MKICILGPVPKGDKNRESWKDWKPAYGKALSAVPGATITNGDEWQDEAGPFTTVGHDANMIKTADAIVVNAEQKLGAGTAMEMVIAKYFFRPVIAVLPKDSHHRKTNVVFEGDLIEDWVHPFILTISDSILENVDAAAQWLKTYQENPEQYTIKNMGIVDQAIAEYLKLKEIQND